MIEKEYVLYVRLDTHTKDLLRLRAAKSRQNTSTFARGLILAGLGEPSPNEAFSLAAIAQQNEQQTQSVVETGA